LDASLKDCVDEIDLTGNKIKEGRVGANKIYIYLIQFQCQFYYIDEDGSFWNQRSVQK